jgi:hypothetical protein
MGNHDSYSDFVMRKHFEIPTDKPGRTLRPSGLQMLAT